MRYLALALLVLAWAGRARAGTYALVIGNNAPPRGSAELLAPLRFADDDATRFYDLFRRMRARVELLSVLDERTQRRHPQAALEAREPSLENLRRVMQTYREAMAQDRQRGEEVRFFFTYSGHGARSASGEAFLALTEGELTEGVLFDEILRDLPASYSHVVVDACNASGVVGVRGLFGREIDATAVAIRGEEIAGTSRLEQFPTLGVLLASTEGNASHEWSQVEAGVFTHEVLSALSGAADVNGDRLIEYSEVQAFIAAANRDLTDPRAVPEVIARPPRINRRAVLVALEELEDVAFLRGSPGLVGRFFVELENGQRHLDAHLSGGLEATLALPADGVAYLRAERGEALLRLRPGASIPFAQLSFRDPRAASRGSIEQSFHDKLFASPFTLDYYRGFVDRTGGLPVDFPGPSLAPLARPPSRLLSGSLLATSGALLVTSGIATYVAWQARRDFEATTLQRPARRYAERYRVASAVAIGSAALASLSAAGAWYLWPRVDEGVEGTADALRTTRTYSLNLAGRW